MDVLRAVLNTAQPTTWVNKSEDDYIESYLLFDITKYSTEWYNVWIEADCYHRELIKYIKRVQNPFQLGLFKIQEEKRRSENVSTQQTIGYHVIHPNDLESALKYPLDYRRYSKRESSVQNVEKHPKFYAKLEDAYEMGNQCNLAFDNEILIIQAQHFSTVRNQGDYYPLYVISLVV
ncbi:uncharacterized protein LOC135832860 [Planococcus citri]|uniref:uncharacterized protein LOC135832860 n=1 Tax=Planococcus citri TaxID=170843 RepID=UPI0031F87F5D